jgi:Ribosomal protein S1
VHISELADRHVEIPEQVVQVGDEIFVKIIDIDLDRRRISLSLKQANEGTVGEASATTSTRPCTACPPPTTSRATTSTRRASTPSRASGSRATTPSARSGSGSTPRRGPGSRRTAARSTEARKADSADGEEADTGNGGTHTSGSPDRDSSSGGALASDEALAALRDKLSGGQS